MKKLPLILIILGLTGTAFWYCTKNASSDDYQIVTLAGGESYAKVSNLYMQVSNNSDGYSALPLHDNEVIYLKIGDGEAYYRYSKSNGNNLKFSAEGFKLFLNDRLIGVKISEDPALLDWLNALKPEEIADLQNLVITDSLSANCLNGLKNLALLKHDPGIVFYEGINSTNAEEILKLFNPVWLVSQGELNKSGIDRLYSFTEIEWLYINNQNLDADRILNLKKLRNLVIYKLKSPPNGEKLDFPKRLKSLTISQSDIANLEFLGSATGLKEIYLVDCASITDISALAGLRDLSGIGFIGCEELTDLSQIGHFPSLIQFSCPASITNQGFDQFIGIHNNLKIIELFGCQKIDNLKSLSDLPGLSCLSIVGDTISTATFFDFKNLDYLSLPVALPGDSLQLKELKGKLPNTIIVPSKGLCLGTGWLLLVFPLFFLMSLSGYFIRKRTRA